MNLETKIVREDRDNRSTVFVEITVDDLPCGRVSVASGPKADIDDLMSGEATLAEIGERWKRFGQKVDSIARAAPRRVLAKAETP